MFKGTFSREASKKKGPVGRLLSRTSVGAGKERRRNAAQAERCHHHNTSDLVKGGQGCCKTAGGVEPTRVPVTNDLLESREGLWEGVRSDLRAVRKEREGEVFGGEQKCFTKQVHKGEEDLCGIKFFRSLLPLRWRWPGRQLNDYDIRANRGWPELPGAFGAVVGLFA